MPSLDPQKPTLESLIMEPREDLAILKIYPQSVDNVSLSIEKKSVVTAWKGDVGTKGSAGGIFDWLGAWIAAISRNLDVGSYPWP